ncbi:biorientation of chromosomes in cell division protein 1-like [Dermochelys coriacea]|uniref:biorientation of chromosomes in cell division protein 1-like n=1 Tax=Dermochelys coriacea TaxID=27794 RepID=UPI0018E80923|nr:biorientation of chromosomes in cell division protein 1-like [Dermochelys coriacea]
MEMLEFGVKWLFTNYKISEYAGKYAGKNIWKKLWQSQELMRLKQVEDEKRAKIVKSDRLSITTKVKFGREMLKGTCLDKQEWNPTVNKNQLRNGLRQSVIQSGMLEAGVDRIISQVVDPKLNHIFRPQKKEETVPALPPEPENQDPPVPSQYAS